MDWIRRRDELGGAVLLQELEAEDPKSYMNALRMNAETFQELLDLIRPSIQKTDTNMRRALPAQLKLQVTLRFLATGDSFKSLAYFFRVPPSSISAFVPQVLRAINNSLWSCIRVSTFVQYMRNTQ